MHRLYPPPIQALAPDEVYRDLGWVAAPAPVERPLVASNMVTTVDGKAVVAGRAQGIGSRVDHQLMRQIRANADAVLLGAGTLRAENVDPSVPERLEELRLARGLRRQPLAIVASASGNLPLERTFFTSSRFERLVLTTGAAPRERREALGARAMVVVAGEERLDLGAALSRLRQEFGVRWLLVEGGPTLNGALLAAGLLDELFWTVAPSLAGGSGRTMVEGPPGPGGLRARLALLSAHLHQHELYLRYRVER